MQIQRAFVVLTAALMPAAVLGHHSPAPYDSTREVVFEGTVTELEWKNPHVLMTIETRAEGGSPVLQEIEASALSQVRTWGLPREALAPGQTVIVRAWPNRSGPRTTGERGPDCASPPEGRGARSHSRHAG